jgi:hypothetical protein
MSERGPQVVKVPAPQIKDEGRVRIGTLSPSLPPVRTPPASTTDNGRVRIGTLSPSFPVTAAR